MCYFPKISAVLAAAVLGSSALVQPALADVLDFEGLGKGGTKGPIEEPPADGGGSTDIGVYKPWMSSDIQWAWDQGGYGQGVTITVVDSFSGHPIYKISGNLGDGKERLFHGQWTLKQAGMIAPQADMVAHDWDDATAVTLAAGRLNVINASYGLVGEEGQTITEGFWAGFPETESIVDYAHAGSAVISKAAGNDYGTAVGQATKSGDMDYLNLALIGAPTAIFVGALSSNNLSRVGDVLVIGAPAAMADYSNVAGSNTAVQSNFLVVGVDGATTGLNGTSFAAPIVAGYAAIVGSKFGSTNAKVVTDQLLLTAISDPGAFAGGYDIKLHGKGIACISCAVAPVAIK